MHRIYLLPFLVLPFSPPRAALLSQWTVTIDRTLLVLSSSAVQIQLGNGPKLVHLLEFKLYTPSSSTTTKVGSFEAQQNFRFCAEEKSVKLRSEFKKLSKLPLPLNSRQTVVVVIVVVVVFAVVVAAAVVVAFVLHHPQEPFRVARL